MKKIPDEIVEKLFFQHLGQEMLFNVKKDGSYHIGEIEVWPYYDGFRPDPNIKQDLLILKPLSSVTDEDKAFCKKHFDIKLDFHHSGTDNFCYENHGNFNCIAGCIQYLQSKGYDLPQHMLGGKTFHEAGLAIYKSEIPES